MNIAFAAIVLFLIFAPGVIGRQVYLSYPLSKQRASAMSEEVALAVIPTILVHLLMFWLIGNLGYHIHFPTLGTLLLGAHDDTRVAAAFRNIEHHVPEIAAYNIASWMIAGIGGYALRAAVLGADLDLKAPWMFRFNNEWFYILTGRQWRYDHERPFDFVWVDALVHENGESFIYSGRPYEYYLGKDGELESLCLRKASKIRLSWSSIPEPIPGKTLVLNYANVSNLNVILIGLEA